MAATTTDDFVVLQAMGRQAGGDSLVWKLVAKALGPASIYNQTFRLGQLFYTKVENEAIAILVTREAWPKLVKKVAKLEVNSDFSVDSIPGGSGVVSDDDRLVVRLETHQRPPAAKPHSDSVLDPRRDRYCHFFQSTAGCSRGPYCVYSHTTPPLGHPARAATKKYLA